MPERRRITSVRFIPLTQGRFAIVDAADYEWLTRFSKWCYNGTKGYAVSSLVRRLSRAGESYQMHQIIMRAPPGVSPDHKNGNKLDNRRSNLRLANGTQNMANRDLQSNNTTGYKGVVRHRGKFRARIGDGLRKGGRHLGIFLTVEEAALAYNTAAVEMYGEFACLNSVGTRFA